MDPTVSAEDVCLPLQTTCPAGFSGSTDDCRSLGNSCGKWKGTRQQIWDHVPHQLNNLTADNHCGGLSNSFSSCNLFKWLPPPILPDTLPAHVNSSCLLLLCCRDLFCSSIVQPSVYLSPGFCPSRAGKPWSHQRTKAISMQHLLIMAFHVSLIVQCDPPHTWNPSTLTRNTFSDKSMQCLPAVHLWGWSPMRSSHRGTEPESCVSSSLMPPT